MGALLTGPGSELASAVCSIPQIISMLGGRMDFPLSVWLLKKDLFSWAPKSLQVVTAAMKLKDICSLEGKL